MVTPHQCHRHREYITTVARVSNYTRNRTKIIDPVSPYAEGENLMMNLRSVWQGHRQRGKRARYRHQRVTESPSISITVSRSVVAVLSRNFCRGSSRGGLNTTFHLTPKPVEFKKSRAPPLLFLEPVCREQLHVRARARASESRTTRCGRNGINRRVPGGRFRFHGS